MQLLWHGVFVVSVELVSKSGITGGTRLFKYIGIVVIGECIDAYMLSLSTRI